MKMSLIQLCCAVLVCCVPSLCFGDGGIYSFVDARSGIHLTNVPDNNRYAVLIAPVTSDDAKRPRRAPSRADGQGRYRVLIKRVAGRFGVEPALVRAVIAVESGYDPNAVSKRGASGLMQLMPGTAKRYGVIDVFDPADNVRGGVQYLADLLSHFDNDLRLALAAYNAGESAVLKYNGRIPPYRETREYVPKVVAIYRKYLSSR
jgi:soluble lytic murein transglycosylase-like protein